MFNKILVAMDMSEMGPKVFDQALSLARASKSDLLLLHVLSAEESNSPIPIPPDLSKLYPAAGNDLTLETWRQQWQEFEAEGLQKLEADCQKAQSLGLRATYQQILGSPAKTICQVALKEQIDLIVIGRRGRSGLEEWLMGSVSNYVFHHASCSVLMINQG